MKLEKSRRLWDVGVTLAQVFWATNSLSHPERTWKEQILCMNMVTSDHMLKDPESIEPISTVFLKQRACL